MNYAMNESNSTFPHQIKIVRSLSNYFDKIIVITASNIIKGNTPDNVSIITTNWQPGKHLRNIIRFYLVALRVILSNRDIVVFSHMTELQSALIAPLTRILSIKHVLWYAHASKSRYLIWNDFWLDASVT